MPNGFASAAFAWSWTATTGPGACLGRRLLHELGCRLTVLGEEPDGQFAHPPEPTAENLAGVLTAVTDAGADVGFCQDPDADRLAVIDAAGRYLGEEYTLAMCVDHVLRQRRGPIVANCASSRMSEDLAERYGVPLFPLGRGRGQRGRRHDCPRGDLRRRGQRRTDRSARGPRPRQLRGHGPAPGRDGRPARCRLPGWPTSCRATKSSKRRSRFRRRSLPAALRCDGKAIFRRLGRPFGRPTARLARPLAVGPRQQHGADRPGDCRGPDGRRGFLALRGRGRRVGEALTHVIYEKRFAGKWSSCSACYSDVRQRRISPAVCSG